MMPFRKKRLPRLYVKLNDLEAQTPKSLEQAGRQMKQHLKIFAALNRIREKWHEQLLQTRIGMERAYALYASANDFYESARLHKEYLGQSKKSLALAKLVDKGDALAERNKSLLLEKAMQSCSLPRKPRRWLYSLVPAAAISAAAIAYYAYNSSINNYVVGYEAAVQDQVELLKSANSEIKKKLVKANADKQSLEEMLAAKANPAIPEAIDTLHVPLGEYVVHVSKQDQTLSVYKRVNYVHVLTEKCSTGKNPADKIMLGDNATPEGIFTVKEICKTTDWLYKKEKAYGDIGFRLDAGYWDKKGNFYPDRKSPILLHGINEQRLDDNGRTMLENMGTPASGGCIRTINAVAEQLRKLYVKPGTKVAITGNSEVAKR